MQKLTTWMLKARYGIVAFFLAATVVCGALTMLVSVNYDMVDYLPDEAPSTIALDVMDNAYETAASQPCG